MFKVSPWIILVLLASACTGTGGRFAVDPGNGNDGLSTAGDRLLGMDFVDTSELGNFTANFGFARSASVSTLVVNLRWTDIETSPNNYVDPNGVFAALNVALPTEGFHLSLNIVAVDRTELTIPADLVNTPFNDPGFASRYISMLSFVHGLLPNVRIVYLGLGNEIDRYTPSNASFWSEFANFMLQTRTWIRPREFGIKVGASATYFGLVQMRKDEMKVVNQQSDIVAFTYYPVNPDLTMKPALTAETEIPKVLETYPTRLISLHETGAPSSSANQSDEDRQSVYVRELFRVWDTDPDHWIFTNFTRLHDWDVNRAQAAAMLPPFSSTDPIVAEFLRTLGFRSYDNNGADKTALLVLRLETSKRGF